MEKNKTDNKTQVNKRRMYGQVISNKMQKTVVVKVSSSYKDPIYKKILEKSKKYAVHSKEKIEVGKNVWFEECRPISKTKKWKVVKVADEK